MEVRTFNTNFKAGCLVCGEDLVYSDKGETLTCFYCRQEFSAHEKCQNHHYICNKCHAAGALDIIEEFCLETESVNPVETAEALMKHPSVKMHGNEHHFLVPAVLLSNYYNILRDKTNLKLKLQKARKRAEQILGGFCGTHGTCGAAVGTGIFVSIITSATPLSAQEWKLSNTLTGRSLLSVANCGGPRCCKRDVYLSISEAAGFLKEMFEVEISVPDKITCKFSNYNKECLKTECRFFRA